MAKRRRRKRQPLMRMSEENLRFLTGQRSAAALGSSGTGSGAPDCDGTIVHCCFPDLEVLEEEGSYTLRSTDGKYEAPIDVANVERPVLRMSEENLRFLTGQRAGAALGSSGTGSGAPDCDGTIVHCCFPDDVIVVSNGSGYALYSDEEGEYFGVEVAEAGRD